MLLEIFIIFLFFQFRVPLEDMPSKCYKILDIDSIPSEWFEGGKKKGTFIKHKKIKQGWAFVKLPEAFLFLLDLLSYHTSVVRKEANWTKYDTLDMNI